MPQEEVEEHLDLAAQQRRARSLDHPLLGLSLERTACNWKSGGMLM